MDTQWVALTNTPNYKSSEPKPVVNFSTKVEEDSIVLCEAGKGVGVALCGNGKRGFHLFERLHKRVRGSGVVAVT